MGDELDTREVEESCALLDTESPVSTDLAKGFSLSVPALGPIPTLFCRWIGKGHATPKIDYAGRRNLLSGLQEKSSIESSNAFDEFES